jgi:dihydroorotase
VADIAVLKLTKGDFGFEDVRGKKIGGNQKLHCELTLREGEVVYDLNGISMPSWQKSTGK